MGLDREFTLIIGADDVVNPKPHAEPVLKALDHFGVGADEAVYIGDSVHDMHSGRAAGGAHRGGALGPLQAPDLEQTKPDHWLERPGELLSLR